MGQGRLWALFRLEAKPNDGPPVVVLQTVVRGCWPHICEEARRFQSHHQCTTDPRGELHRVDIITELSVNLSVRPSSQWTIGSFKAYLCGIGRLAQLVRVPALQAGCHWFESSTAHFSASPCSLSRCHTGFFAFATGCDFLRPLAGNRFGYRR